MLDGKALMVRNSLRLTLSYEGASVKPSTVKSCTKNITGIQTWNPSWWAFGRAGRPQRVPQHAQVQTLLIHVRLT